jgi:Tol biopolymer transport system component
MNARWILPAALLLLTAAGCTPSSTVMSNPTGSPTATEVELLPAPTLAPTSVTSAQPSRTAAPPTPAPQPSTTATPLGGGAGQLVFASRRGGAYLDIYLLRLSDRHVARLTFGDGNSFPGPCSPDGSRLLFTGFGPVYSYVGVMGADGSQPLNLTGQLDSDEAFPAWSPDGTQIVFTSRRDGNNELYLMNSGGSDPRRLTFWPGDDFAPAWSPDGSQIAFVSDRDNPAGIYAIYLLQVEGLAVRRLTAGGNDYTPAWSPDGGQIAFRSIRDGQSDIWVVKLDGSGLANLTRHPAEDWAPAWSPDGAWIAFQTDRDGNREIYLMRLDGSGLQNLTQDPQDDELPHWRN